MASHETNKETEQPDTGVVIDLDYIRRLKVLPDCPFDDPPQHDFDGEDLGA